MEQKSLEGRRPGLWTIGTEGGTWVVSVDLKAHSLLSMVVLGENFEGSGRRVGFQPLVEGEPAAEHAASYCAFRKLAAYRVRVEELC